jgi:phosphatidylglycerophosphate synthase
LQTLGGRVLALLPQVLTGLRLLSAPLLWWLITGLHLRAALVCLVFAMASDAADGPLARRFATPSRAGAYFDVLADFAVIVAALLAFAWIGVYPAWLVALTALVFAAFVASSRLVPTIYDPVGRYIGGILFAAVAATLIVHDTLAQAVILWVVTTALGVTLAARAVFTALVLGRR